MAFLGHDVAKEKSQTTEITTKSVTLLHEDASSQLVPLLQNVACSSLVTDPIYTARHFLLINVCMCAYMWKIAVRRNILFLNTSRFQVFYVRQIVICCIYNVTFPLREFPVT